MRAVLRACMRAVFRIRVEGTWPDAAAPALFAANHPSVLDSLLLSVLLPCRNVVVLPREDLRSAWLRMAPSSTRRRTAARRSSDLDIAKE